MIRTVVAGNWKMNKTYNEAIDFINELKKEDLKTNGIEVQLFVPYIYLNELKQMVKDMPITIGAQNIHQEELGAYTGEISADMLNSINISDTLIGHSERRQYYNETDKVVNQKVLTALKKEINPVVCIGETLDERNGNITHQVLKTQLVEAFKNVETKDMYNVIIAYEPVWAIGTGKTATAEDANEACQFVREVIEELYGKVVANTIVIQYGGSVKPENVDEILSQPHINGALVGGASLEVESFKKLINL